MVIKIRRLKTDNTHKVIKLLKRHTNKQILIRDIQELPEYASYLGAVDTSDECIEVYLNFSHPEEISEATFVHEILHIVLDYEGFPEITINNNLARKLPLAFQKALPKLRGHFSSCIDHPEIFRRMISNFTLNIEAYFSVQVKQKLRRFKNNLKKGE